MVGHITEVLPPPPAGVYGFYAGDRGKLSPSRLAQLRAELPQLRGCFNEWCTCGQPHTRQEMVIRFGAVHGQRLRGRMRLSCDDEEQLAGELGGEWDIELIMDDWKRICGLAGSPPPCQVLCKMEHAGPARLSLLEAYPPGRRAEKQWIIDPSQPEGFVVKHAAPPLKQRCCMHCGAVGAVRMAGQPAPGGAAPVTVLNACAGCRKRYFCSHACQRAAWTEHKDECRAWQKHNARQQQRQERGAQR
ncbi:hypothetical protein ABPG75_008976 [Micractinium tetrahymenae]